MNLPSIEQIKTIPPGSPECRRALICCDGFEARGLSYSDLAKSQRFEAVIIVAYKPSRKSNLEDLLNNIRAASPCEPKILTYNRFDPVLFEFALNDVIPQLELFDEIHLDISVMSKLLILILLNSLRNYSKCLRIIYTEPDHYAPTEQSFKLHKKDAALAAISPSIGVRDVVRTPSLSSLSMQRSPACLIAFTSFNEQLIRALLYSINPSRLILIGCMPPIHKWRAKACQDIHEEIIKDFREDNQIDPNGFLTRKTSTLDYKETFNIISDIYAETGITHRLFLAPTGSKMQAVGCALAKIKFPDIHIEYPTPESFIIDDYSSRTIRHIHQVSFLSFSTLNERSDMIRRPG